MLRQTLLARSEQLLGGKLAPDAIKQQVKVPATNVTKACPPTPHTHVFPTESSCRRCMGISQTVNVQYTGRGAQKATAQSFEHDQTAVWHLAVWASLLQALPVRQLVPIQS